MSAAMVLGTVLTVLIGVFPDRFYALMPYATNAHPYHMEHVLEYIAIFIGGSIPFFICIKKMKPHDEITLDFDWFYRVVLNKLVLWISKLCDGIFAWCDKHASRTAEYLRTHFGDPYLWTQGSSSVKIRKFSFENESRLIGDVMTVIVLVLTVMLALVTYLAS
jgi:multicomponent Na+:H+ antiporter subunit D